LNNEKIKVEIENQIRDLEKQISHSWNPHIKLEFMKMAIRTAFADVARKQISLVRKK
jgi:hypothetical protein